MANFPLILLRNCTTQGAGGVRSRRWHDPAGTKQCDNPRPRVQEAQMRRISSRLLLALAIATPALVQAETVGHVDTAFKFIGRNHQVVVEAFDDPRVKGVACYVSRARTGGIKGSLGLAEDTADASVACRQVGEITFSGPLREQEEVFSQSASILFKKVRIVRMVDAKRNTLVYLVYSDKLIEGSPQNNVTAVPVPSALPIPLR
jgi:CreA protein